MVTVILTCLILPGGCDWGRRYVGMGDVVAVDAQAGDVTIRHDRIPGLMEPATSRFAVPAADVQAVLAPGSRVRFVIRRNGEALQITGATVIAAGNPGMHDHTPHHGGIVAMAGLIHLEAVAGRDGTLVLYLTDLYRRPLPLDDVTGKVVVDLSDGKQTLPLARKGDVLTATAAPPTGATSLNTRFELRRAGEPVEVSFLLPLNAGASGAAGIPVRGCVAPALTPGDNLAPRCTLSFAKSVVALAATPDAATLLVAQVDLGLSAWRLPAGAFTIGFAPPPAVVLPAPEAPHPEAPNAVVVRPDGGEVAVAMENRLIFYDLDTGRVRRAFAVPGGIVRAVSWSPDGAALLVSSFYSPEGVLVDAGDGHVLRRFAVEREGAAVAFAPDGRRVAVASERGPVSLFDLRTAAPPLLLRGSSASIRGLAFVGQALAAAGEDGMLRLFDVVTGKPITERRVDTAVRAMAFNVRRGVVATAGLEPRVHVTPIADGPPLEPLAWHEAQVLSLAWAGDTLASGDAAGGVAIWDLFQ